MIGQNRLEINNATMNEAIQHWLNTTQLRLDARVEVTSVTSKDSGSVFIVNTKPLGEEKEE